MKGTITDGRQIIQEKDRIQEVRNRGIKKCKFKCPMCGNTQTGEDLESVGADWQNAYFNCIGRYTENKGCNRTLGGLFQNHKICVQREDGEFSPVFEFAD